MCIIKLFTHILINGENGRFTADPHRKVKLKKLPIDPQSAR